jgi:DNA mismatch endonuclease (patch repair protein)
MTDIFTREKRSEIMSKIRGKWTKPERAVHNILKGNRVRHRMHPKIFGNPDVLVYPKKLIFVDGDFWHGYRAGEKKLSGLPKFWRDKIATNKRRDRRNRAILRDSGYEVIRIWEHQLSSPSSRAAGEVLSAIGGLDSVSC